ncbi:MAG: hypothetical protein ABWZ98_06140, partial [Nakamurella sp.]
IQRHMDGAAIGALIDAIGLDSGRWLNTACRWDALVDECWIRPDGRLSISSRTRWIAAEVIGYGAQDVGSCGTAK